MKKEDVLGKELSQKLELLAISPMDGRYNATGEKLNEYFSTFALEKYRVKVEIEWLCFLIEQVKSKILSDAANIPNITETLRSISKNFSLDDAVKVTYEIEAKTNHDVKAIEYFIREKLLDLGLDLLVPYIHIGCTSEDINNLAYGMMLRDALENVWLPAANELACYLENISFKYKDVSMLAHTHGQPASTTTVGKELVVFANRLRSVLWRFDSSTFYGILGKFNGATGTYAAMSVAFPEYDWINMNKCFVEEYLGLKFNRLTTQIEPHDYMCEIFNNLRAFNNIVLDLDRDMWLYISMEYFKQLVVKGEVGSSTMPHKVNPIRFENSEANVDIANAILMALSNKLPISRMQRDLSDSSSQRNIGTALAHSLLVIEQTMKGLKRTDVNTQKLASDLENHWEILAEPIQTVMRKNGIADAYEQLKDLTRGEAVTKETITEFINSRDLPEDDKKRLLSLIPATYTGAAERLVNYFTF